jgi:hypothetical protein
MSLIKYKLSKMNYYDYHLGKYVKNSITINKES